MNLEKLSLGKPESTPWRRFTAVETVRFSRAAHVSESQAARPPGTRNGVDQCVTVGTPCSLAVSPDASLCVLEREPMPPASAIPGSGGREGVRMHTLLFPRWSRPAQRLPSPSWIRLRMSSFLKSIRSCIVFSDCQGNTVITVIFKCIKNGIFRNCD